MSDARARMDAILGQFHDVIVRYNSSQPRDENGRWVATKMGAVKAGDRLAAGPRGGGAFTAHRKPYVYTKKADGTNVWRVVSSPPPAYESTLIEGDDVFKWVKD